MKKKETQVVMTKKETQVVARIGEKLRRQLELTAKKNYRSLTSEVSLRLTQSLQAELDVEAAP